MTTNTQVLLVGAYERENFGDLLFLLRTRDYMINAQTTAVAPFSGDMMETLGQNIPAFAETVRDKAFDAIWVVGGEVGGTTVADAYRMSAAEDDYEKFLALSPKARIAELERVSGMTVAASPYLPRPSSRVSTMGSNLVVNSVGLSGMRNLFGSRRDETWGAIQEASYVSVRDKESSDVLTKNSIQHELAPDLVHSYGLTVDHFGPRDSDVALIQVKAKVLASLGAEEFAATLAKSKQLENFRLRLFSAGNARGHDSIELYEEVALHFNRIAPNRSIEVSRTLMPLEKLREIATCGLWVGTSLHGLIISSSFDTPRVALELDKLVRYATTWQETMPVGVAMSDVDAAIESALLESPRSIASGRAMELAEMADRSAKLAASAALEQRPRGPLVSERAAVSESIMRRRRSLPNRIHQVLRPLG